MATSGNCGTNLTYEIENNVLTISGTGTTIMDSPKWDKTFTSVVFDTPNLTTIGNMAFIQCTNLASITIPEGVTTIGNMAFNQCTNLSSVTLPASLTSISSNAFYGCASLTSIVIPDGVTTIESSTFYNCTNLASITLPDSVTTINKSAFYRCTNLASITIPDGVTTIGESAFDSCTSLTSITLPDSVTTINRSAFYNCTNLASIVIPDGVTTIGDSAFKGCSSLTSIVLPDGVTTINRDTFNGCTSLTSITLPTSLTTIGERAFKGCSSLTSIVLPASLTSINNEAFLECTNLATVYNLSNLNVVLGIITNGYVAFYATEVLTSLPEEDGPEVTPTTTTIFDITPGVKKKEIKATIDKAVQDYQDRYGIIPVTLSQTGWNRWDGVDDGQYREFKQTVTVALENDDFILIDADGIYSDKMSEFNVYGKAGPTSADTDGDGIAQLTSIDFFADEIPDMDIVCNIIVFAYNDGDKGKPKTIEERLSALEERLSDIGEP